MAGDQEPAARTISSASRTPPSVTTPLTRLPSVSKPLTAVWRSDSAAAALEHLGQRVHVLARRDVAVVRVQHSADRRRLEAGELAHPVAVELFGLEADLRDVGRLLAAVRQALLGPVDVRDAGRPEAEVALAGVVQLAEELDAGHRQVSQHGHGAFDVLLAAGGAELPEPRDEAGARTRPDVEGAVRLRHPPQRAPDHPGRGERDAVAGHEQAGVAVGAPGADVAAVHQRHVDSALGQVVGAADADRSRADHDRGCTIRHHPSPRQFPIRV